MPKTIVRVLAQYTTGKKKGGQEVTFRADFENFMYDYDNCIEVIQSLLDNHSGFDEGSLTYVSHELIFKEPVVIDDKIFENELSNLRAFKS